MAVGNSCSEAIDTSETGLVYLFDNVAGVWTQRTNAVISPAPVMNAYFGSSVALSAAGDVLVVGETHINNCRPGRVYTYDLVEGVMVLRGTDTRAPASANNDKFGATAAITPDGSMLVVGAPWVMGTYSMEGLICVYDLVENAWVLRGSFAHPEPAAWQEFGAALAINAAGTMIVAGLQNAGPNDAGTVLTWDWTGSVWLQRTPDLNAPEILGGNPRFGASVALSADGNLLAVSAPDTDACAVTNAGKIAIFDDVDGEWQMRGIVSAPNAQYWARFGTALALIPTTPDTLFVGSPLWVMSTPTYYSNAGKVEQFSLPLYPLTGTVQDNTMTPVARTVRAYDRSTGELLKETTSSAETGAFSIGVFSTDPVYIIALDDDAGTDYNAIIFDRIEPA